PTRLWFAPGQLFEQLPSHHPAAQKTVLRKPLILLRKKLFLKNKVLVSQKIYNGFIGVVLT
ncbi:hypothetical protein, partial [Flavobacterium psychrophilum]|uniref:hypothetical protein n=1 Tax=Flavobacterium psychrophilum TaxID=96345 RepID=UPI001C9A9969